MRLQGLVAEDPALDGRAAPGKAALTAARAADWRTTRAWIVAHADDPRLRSIWLLLVLVVYTLAYLGFAATPGNTPQHPLGWWGWWDQGQYLKSARAIASWRLDQDTFWYPLGYPALGALFLPFTSMHAFFVVDAALVLASAALVWEIAKRYMSCAEALAVGIVFMATHSWLLASSLVIPWNTLPIQAGLYTAIYVLLTQPARRAALVMGALAACFVWIRPIDVLTLAPLLACAIWDTGTWHRRIRVGAICAAMVAASWLAEAALKYAVFGDILSNYDHVARDVGFGAWPVAIKLYWLLVDGRSAYDALDPGLFIRYPWLPFSLVALIFIARREGLRGAAIAAACAIGFGTYMQFNGFNAGSIYRVMLIHYIAWLFPLLFLWSYALLRNGSRRWIAGGIGATVAAFVVAFGIHVTVDRSVVTAAGDGTFAVGAHRPLMLEWARNAAAKMDSLELADSRRTLRRFHDYEPQFVRNDVRVLLTDKADDDWLRVSFGDTPPARLRATALSWDVGFDMAHAAHFLPVEWFVDVGPAMQSALDVAGPHGEPDGVPDIEIAVNGAEAVLASVATWQIQVTDAGGRSTGEGAWSSDRQQRALWWITAQKPADGRRMLYLKDNGKALRADRLAVVGLDAAGQRVLTAAARREPRPGERP